MNYRAKIAARLKRQSAFYEQEFADGTRLVEPVGVDKFDDALRQVEAYLGTIKNIIKGRELYDLSNGELDQVRKAFDNVISWSKDSKARMRGKDYSGSFSQKPGAEEFLADEKQEGQLEWERRRDTKEVA